MEEFEDGDELAGVFLAPMWFLQATPSVMWPMFLVSLCVFEERLFYLLQVDWGTVYSL